MKDGFKSHFSEGSFGSLDQLNETPSSSSRKSRRTREKVVGLGIMTSNVTSGPSAADDRNVWARHIKNGDDRTHVPPLSKKLFIIRVVQLVLAVLFLVLAAFAAFTLNMGNVSLRA